MRIIGDVHGKLEEYLLLTEGVNDSVQIGDLGLSKYSLEERVKPNWFDQHLFFPGNHDERPTWSKLDSFGLHNHIGINFFYVSGAWSIDNIKRIKYNLPHTEMEELNFSEMFQCVKEYALVKPNLVLTHDCPASVYPYLGIDELSNQETMIKYGHSRFYKNNTSLLLEEMFKIHQPLWWVFGHHHKKFDEFINGTRFICLSELEYIDV